MNVQTSPDFRTTEDSRILAVERLTALWALSEAALGGILHAFRVPLTGIFVGGAAVLFIALIAHFARDRNALLRATLIVLIIKAMVSPHSPVGAYVAVAFQGVLGWALFRLPVPFRISALVFSVVALVESALQRVFTLVILFGASLWESVDAFGVSVMQQFGASGDWRLSQWLVGVYLGLYILAGVLIGWLAGKLPAWVESAQVNNGDFRWQSSASTGTTFVKKPRSRRPKMALLLVVCGLIALATAFTAPPAHAAAKTALLMLRVVAIIVIWYVLVAPLLLKLIHALLRKQESAYATQIARVLAVFPLLRGLTKQSWMASRQYRGWPRYRFFIITLIVAALTADSPAA